LFQVLKSKVLIVTLGFAIVVAVVFFGLIIWRYTTAKRLNDLVEIHLIVMYDCNRFPRQKYDQRYWKNEKLEGCGVPDVKLQFLDDRRKLMLQSVTDRQGKFRLYENSTVNSPLENLKFVQINSERCENEIFEFSLDRSHSFYGESSSSRQYHYSGDFKFFCVPRESFQ